VLLAGILTFAMLSRRNESMAIKTSGLDILYLLRPVIFWSAAVTLMLFALNLFFIPWSQQKYDQFWQTQVEKKPLPSLSKLERFWYKGDNAIYNILLFRKDTQTLEGVKVYLFDRQFHLIKIIAATRAQWWKSVQGERGEVQLWHFYQGFTQSFGPGEKMAGEKFGEMVQPLTEHSNDFSFLERKDREMDQIDLYRYISRLERDGYDSTQYRVEFHSRISQSVAPLILVILGIALVLRREKVNIPATVAVGTAIYFGYWLFFGFCTSFGRAGRWPVLLADWLPHLAFAILTIFLLRQASR
jgi:lipopolysaccharide export system permease protein